MPGNVTTGTVQCFLTQNIKNPTKKKSTFSGGNIIIINNFDFLKNYDIISM